MPSTAVSHVRDVLGLLVFLFSIVRGTLIFLLEEQLLFSNATGKCLRCRFVVEILRHF